MSSLSTCASPTERRGEKMMLSDVTFGPNNQPLWVEGLSRFRDSGEHWWVWRMFTRLTFVISFMIPTKILYVHYDILL